MCELYREEWIKQKSNHIKEMTVRGLEPEIQKLISKNKSEMKKVKAMHEAELLEADERASKRCLKLKIMYICPQKTLFGPRKHSLGYIYYICYIDSS